MDNIIEFPRVEPGAADALSWDAAEPPPGTHPHVILLFRANAQIAKLFDRDPEDFNPEEVEAELRSLAAKLIGIADLMREYEQLPDPPPRKETVLEAFRRRYFERKKLQEERERQ